MNVSQITYHLKVLSFTGEIGLKGELGLEGPVGSKGEPGVKGEQGYTGPPGVKGERGEPVNELVSESEH